MAEFTIDVLRQIIPNNPQIEEWYGSLVLFLPQYDITSPDRIAAFLAQCSHESNNFTALKENLNYRWESLRRVFPKYFPTDALAQKYAHNQPMIANRVYANRMGNGPEESGDGWRYRGQGLIQLTGRENQEAFANSCGMQLEDMETYLGTFDGAVHSACWFWHTRNINVDADEHDTVGMTRKINGGTIGLEDREARFNNALEILSA